MPKITFKTLILPALVLILINSIVGIFSLYNAYLESKPKQTIKLTQQTFKKVRPTGDRLSFYVESRNNDTNKAKQENDQKATKILEILKTKFNLPSERITTSQQSYSTRNELDNNRFEQQVTTSFYVDIEDAEKVSIITNEVITQGVKNFNTGMYNLSKDQIVTICDQLEEDNYKQLQAKVQKTLNTKFLPWYSVKYNFFRDGCDVNKNYMATPGGGGGGGSSFSTGEINYQVVGEAELEVK
jgi:uncharacterized protein YggE